MRKSNHRHAYRQASFAHYDTSLILHLFDSVLIQGGVYKNCCFWIGLICFSKQNIISKLCQCLHLYSLPLLDMRCKSNKYKASRGRPPDLLDAFCTFNVRPFLGLKEKKKSTELKLHTEEM